MDSMLPFRLKPLRVMTHMPAIALWTPVAFEWA